MISKPIRPFKPSFVVENIDYTQHLKVTVKRSELINIVSSIFRVSFRSLWPEDRAFAWILFFAFLFYLVYALFQLIAPLVAYSGDKISLLYLPAFIRVLAVLVAGIAGALGIFVGHIMVYAVYKSDPLSFAISASAINALAPLIALIFTRFVFRTNRLLHVGWRALLVLSLLSAVFAGLLKAGFWFVTHLGELGSLDSALVNALGNFLGIVAGYVLLRFLQRSLPFELRLKS